MNAPETITPELDAQRVPHAWLAPSPTNPRKTFPAESLAQMAASMEQHDMLQPILVRPWPMTTYVWPGGATDSPFEIVAGDDENTYLAEDPTDFDQAVELLARKRVEEPDLNIVLYAQVDA